MIVVKMFNLQRAFELSLRGRDPANTHKDPAAFAAVHKQCTGRAHASGNADPHARPVVKSDSNSSIRSRSSSRTADCYLEIRSIDESSANGTGASKDKLDYVKSFSNSTSSFEGHSDTDSSENSKCDPIKSNGGVDEKFLRLHNTSTKASLAKTAKMRYLDEMSPTCDESPTFNRFKNGNDHGTNGYSKNGDQTDEGKFARSPLRSSFRERTCSPAPPPRNTNQKKLTPDVKTETTSNGKPPIAAKSFLVLDSPLAKPRAGSFRGTNPLQKPPWNSPSAKISPANTQKQNFVRTGSLRNSLNRKKKYPCVLEYWRELIALAEKRKYGWLTIGKNGQGLLKELQEMAVEKTSTEDTVSQPCNEKCIFNNEYEALSI